MSLVRVGKIWLLCSVEKKPITYKTEAYLVVFKYSILSANCTTVSGS